jgi:hypothetical protein
MDKEMWTTYTMEYYSDIKKNEIMALAVNSWNWMSSY